MISLAVCMNTMSGRMVRHLAVALFAVMLAAPASAQLACKETSTNRGVVSCDMTYRNTALNCKNGNIYPSCYKGNMPMKDTAKQTFKDISPYVYSYARDPADKKRPYSGVLARGAGAGPSEVFAPIGEAPAGVAKQKACVNQIFMDTKTLEDDAKLARLQLDNCANQYILNTAIYPYHKENVSIACPVDDSDPTRRCTQADLCQPLRMIQDPKQEYLASDYIKAAWTKLLNDPAYRMNKDAKGEPHLADGIKLTSKIAVPNEKVLINQLAASEYEEIIDPSHPFTPRWDFTDNERDKYSPKTVDYSGDKKNAVFCAGDAKDKIYKVDILTFREKSLGFDKKITDRVDWNKNCKANAGMEANPCCKVNMHGFLGIPDPNPAHWTCDFQPCGTCYFKSQPANWVKEPVCSTDYANPTDRKSLRDDPLGGKLLGPLVKAAAKTVKKVTGIELPMFEYLPVHPALRIAGLGQAMANMAFSKLPVNAAVSQVTTGLNSQFNVLSSLPGGSLIRDAMPVLEGKQKLGDKIQSEIKGLANSVGKQAIGMAANQIAGITDLNQFTQFAAILQSPQSLLETLAPDLPFGDVIALANGQGNIMAHIPIGQNLAQAISTVTSINSMMARMTPESLLSQGTDMLKSQVTILNSLPTNLSINGIQKLMNDQIDSLARLPSDTLLSAAKTQLGGSFTIPGLGNISGNLSVGEALGMLKDQSAGMSAFKINIPLSSTAAQLSTETLALFKGSPSDISVAGAQELIGSQISQLTGLPGNMSLDEARINLGGGFTIPGLGSISGSGSMAVQDALKMLNVNAQSIGGLTLDGKIAEFTGMMTSQIGDILKLPPGMDIKSITGMLGSMSKTMNGLANKLPLDEIRKTVDEQMKGLLKMEGLAAGKMKTLVQDNLKMIDNLVPDGLKGVISGGVGDLKNLLGDASGMMNSISKKFTSTLTDLKGDIASGLKPLTDQLKQVQSTIRDAVGGLTDKIAEVQNVVKSNIAALQTMIDQKIEVATAFLNKQLNSLTGISGKLPIGQVAQALDGNMVGALTSIPAIANLPGMDKVMNVLNGNFAANLPGLGKVTNPPLMLFLQMSVLLPFPRTAKCTPSELGAANSTTMSSLCKDLRAPYTNINKLKMRYHNPDDKANMTLKKGVMEGLSFKDYFYDDKNKMAHMPYPRLWDTGRSIQENENYAGQDPNDVNGTFTAIVGVGREGATDAVNAGLKDGEKHEDERCMYGGWGEDTTVGGVTIKIPDPVTSWTELKLYQSYTTRETNTVCLGRYDKAFKYRSTENQILQNVGARPPITYRTECDKDSNGKAKPGTCKFTEGADLPEGTSMATAPGKYQATQDIQMGIPLAWRGYLSASDPAKRFPNLGGTGAMEKGLDRAMCGDIILLPTGGADAKDKPGLPKLARVLCARGEDSSVKAVRCQGNNKNCYLDIAESDAGKWPDVCGTTEMRGQLKKRRIFKPGQLPNSDAAEVKRLNWTAGCDDARLARCEMKPWGDLQIYHPGKDTRKGYSAAATP